jgi:hypothetical protein
MKRLSPAKFVLAAACALGLAAALSARADTIAQWTFETGAPSATPPAWNGTVGASGTTPGMTFPSDLSADGSGAAGGFHATAGTLWVSPVGNGSLRSLSANQWLQTSDYYQFTFTPSPSVLSAGYTFSGIGMSWDQTASSSGPKNWYLSYSTDGSTFTKFGSDYSLAFFSWNSSTVQGNNESVSFTGADETALATAVNAGNTVYFRVVDDSAVRAGRLMAAMLAPAVRAELTTLASLQPFPNRQPCPSWAALACWPGT